MDFAGINFIAVLVAAAAGFAFGAIYYTVLGKQWLAAVGKSADDLKNRTAMPYIVSAAGLLVMASVLAGHFAQHGAEVMTAGHALESALVLWAGFIVTSMATNCAFEGARPQLFALNAGHWLGVLVVQGLVLIAF